MVYILIHDINQFLLPFLLVKCRARERNKQQLKKIKLGPILFCCNSIYPLTRTLTILNKMYIFVTQNLINLLDFDSPISLCQSANYWASL